MLSVLENMKFIRHVDITKICFTNITSIFKCKKVRISHLNHLLFVYRLSRKLEEICRLHLSGINDASAILWREHSRRHSYACVRSEINESLLPGGSGISRIRGSGCCDGVMPDIYSAWYCQSLFNVPSSWSVKFNKPHCSLSKTCYEKGTRIFFTITFKSRWTMTCRFLQTKESSNIRWQFYFICKFSLYPNLLKIYIFSKCETILYK